MLGLVHRIQAERLHGSTRRVAYLGSAAIRMAACAGMVLVRGLAGVLATIVAAESALIGVLTAAALVLTVHGGRSPSVSLYVAAARTAETCMPASSGRDGRRLRRRGRTSARVEAAARFRRLPIRVGSLFRSTRRRVRVPPERLRVSYVRTAAVEAIDSAISSGGSGRPNKYPWPREHP
jgi:hypothetical protein